MNVRDPLLIVNEPPSPEEREHAKANWYGTPENPAPRSDDKLRGDLIRAFDDLHDIKHDIYKLAKEYKLAQSLRQDLKRANWMIWLAALVIGPIFSEFLKWILKKVF